MENTVDDYNTKYVFQGVGRKQRTKRILMSRINGDGSNKEVTNSIISYAADCGVKVTYVRILKYWDTRDPTYTTRINVIERDYDRAIESSFWPPGVLVRDWIERPQQNDYRKTQCRSDTYDDRNTRYDNVYNHGFAGDSERTYNQDNDDWKHEGVRDWY